MTFAEYCAYQRKRECCAKDIKQFKWLTTILSKAEIINIWEPL